MSRLVNLINAIREEAERINHQEEDTRTDLSVLLIRSIDKTMVEIKRGADSDDFQDLTVVNLIILGANEGYSAQELREFVEELKSDSGSDD